MLCMLNGGMKKRKFSRSKRGQSEDLHGAGPQDSNPAASERGDKRAEGRSSGRSDSRIWLFGVHAVCAALRNPDRRCRRLVVTNEAREIVDEALALATEEQVPRPRPDVVERSAINKLLPDGAVHQGMALEVQALESPAIEHLCRDLADVSPALVVIIDQGTDPRNVGSVMRSAAAFGASAVIVQDRHAPEATGVLAKAASGALETMPLVRVTNLSRTLEQLKEAGFWCVGLDGHTDETISTFDWPQKTVLVLGAEGKGMRRLTRENCDFLARIPMSETMESLNLSNAAAIALYEVYRCRLS